MSFMKPELYYKIILPLGGVDGTATLGISSPGDEFNYFSKLLELVDPRTNEPIFDVIRVGTVCPACAEAKVFCTHNKKNNPIWKGQSRHELTQLIMKDQIDLFNRETGGIPSGGNNYMYDKKWLKEFENRKRYIFKNPVEILYLGIDPSGGGSSSDYTILTMAAEEGQTIVIYILTYIPIIKLTKFIKCLSLLLSSFVY